jgi:hypothetical protein
MKGHHCDRWTFWCGEGQWREQSPQRWATATLTAVRCIAPSMRVSRAALRLDDEGAGGAWLSVSALK